MNPILYPAANNLHGEYTSIKVASRGDQYTCLHCKGRMIAKQGKEVQWHFAHFDDAGECSPDLALHSEAVRRIERGFKSANDKEGEYPVRYRRRCGHEIYFNIVPHVSRCVIEYEWEHSGKNYRADIAFISDNTSPLIVEVVNTNPLSPDKKASYKAKDMSVLSVDISWSTIDKLDKEIVPSSTIRYPKPGFPCRDCDVAKYVRDARKAEAYRLLALPTEPIGGSFTSWEHSRPLEGYDTGRPMYREVKKEVFRQAQLLVDIGFEQSRKTPYVFSKEIKGSKDKVFADLGGSRIVPIWEEIGVMVYMFGEDCNHYVIQQVTKSALRERGIIVRDTFEEPKHGCGGCDDRCPLWERD